MTGKTPLLRAAVLAVLIMLQAAVAAPAAAGSCHCFKDRSFDPAEPSSIDPYILATVQNSFFAAAFGIPKRSVVQAKMQGSHGDDLWIAYYAAEKSGESPGSLMASKGRDGSWHRTLRGLEKLRTPLAPDFAAALAGDGDPGALAAAAAGEALRQHLASTPQDIDDLVSAGASTAEMVAASVLGHWSGKKGAVLYRDVTMGRATWGGIAHSLGLKAEDLDKKIAELFR